MSTKIESVNVGSNRKIRVPLAALFLIFILLLGAAAGFAILGNNTTGDLLTYNLSAPTEGATDARIEIIPGDGNLSVDPLTGNEPVLASGTLQYLESQGEPAQTMVTFLNRADLTLKASAGGGQPWFNVPWKGCNGATDWQIHLNPTVVSDVTAHTDGGNVNLNFAGTAVTHVSADTGGGNMDVILPDNVSSLNVEVKTGGGDVSVTIGSRITGSSGIRASSGAGNVVVRLPEGVEARIHVTTGMGKLIVDERFSKIDDATYQTPGYESAADKVEITASSGAGNVSINRP